MELDPRFIRSALCDEVLTGSNANAGCNDNERLIVSCTISRLLFGGVSSM